MTILRVYAQTEPYKAEIITESLDEDGKPTEKVLDEHKSFNSIEELASYLADNIHWDDFDWSGEELYFVNHHQPVRHILNVSSHGGALSEEEQEELQDFLQVAQEPKKELYNCPACGRDLPEDAGWTKIVTQRQSWDAPEEAEYICNDCAERAADAKGQEQYERKMDQQWD